MGVLIRIKVGSEYSFKDKKMRLGQVLRYWGDGVGSRTAQNLRIKGMGMDGFKNPALSPLFITMTGGIIFVIAFCTRSLTRNVDVTWQKEQTPQNALQGKQFKMFNLRGIEYDKLEKPPQY